MPGTRTLNSALINFGLAADVLVVDKQAGVTFGRREAVNDPQVLAKAGAPDATDADRARVKSPAQLATAQAALRNSIDSLAQVLGVGWAPLPGSDTQRPKVTSIGFDVRPHRLPTAQLVQVVYSHGFVPGEYVHSASLGIVVPPRHATELALVQPLADAPPVMVVYVGKNSDGDPMIVTATAQANWLTLGGGHYDPEGPADQPAYDLLGRLMAQVRREVVAARMVFTQRNLYAFVGPGASEAFEIEDRKNRIDPTHWDRYVVTKQVPRGPNGELVSVDYLNLRGYTAGILGKYTLPEHLFVLDEDTVTGKYYTSKRGLVGMQPVSDVPLPSNAMALWIRPARPDDATL